MSKIPYLHYSKDTNNLIKSFYLALIPLIIFNFYKNGLYLYNNNLINIFHIFIPLYFPLISILTAYIVSKIFKEEADINILNALIISLTVSINTNYLVYPIVLFAIFSIIKYLKLKIPQVFNELALTRLFLILSLLINVYSYLNIAEKLNKFNYNSLDIFLGYHSGGLGTTSLFLIIISFIILSFNKFYKKNIVISSTLGYIIPIILTIFISNNSSILPYILNGHTYYSFVFLLPTLYSTPNTSKSMIIYGLFVGFLTSLIVLFFNYYEASYISIFIISLFIPLLNKLANKKYLQN